MAAERDVTCSQHPSNRGGECRDERLKEAIELNANTTGHDRLQAVFDVLDDQLGDTDPHTDIPWDDWDDDDLKAEHPLMWCCRQLSEVLGKPAQEAVATETQSERGTPQNPIKYTEAERIRDQHWARGF